MTIALFALLLVGGPGGNQYYVRRTDGSKVGEGRIPRLKVEYQLSPAIFLRLVGQYTAQFQDSLRDDSRNTFQLEWLFSYLPTPGTVIYVGYGSTLQEPEAFRFQRLSRAHDSYFVKLSYLFRR